MEKPSRSVVLELASLEEACRRGAMGTGVRSTGHIRALSVLDGWIWATFKLSIEFDESRLEMWLPPIGLQHLRRRTWRQRTPDFDIVEDDFPSLPSSVNCYAWPVAYPRAKNCVHLP